MEDNVNGEDEPESHGGREREKDKQIGAGELWIKAKRA